MLDGLAAAQGVDGAGTELATTLQRLAPRWFLVRNSRVKSPPILMNPRQAMTVMRGPMTRTEIRRARNAMPATKNEGSPFEAARAAALAL